MTLPHTTSHAPQGGEANTYERTDLSARPIVIALVVCLLSVLLIFLAMWGTARFFVAQRDRLSPPPNPLAASVGRKEPPLPRLQPAPMLDIADLRAKEEATLHSYAWADKANGTVRIPIERAIELLAQRGLPARPDSGAGQ